MQFSHSLSTRKSWRNPLRIRGVAMTADMSRNFIYTPEELQAFAGKLFEASVYILMKSQPAGKSQLDWE
jgi:hypothetical protein